MVKSEIMRGNIDQFLDKPKFGGVLLRQCLASDRLALLFKIKLFREYIEHHIRLNDMAYLENNNYKEILNDLENFFENSQYIKTNLPTKIQEKIKNEKGVYKQLFYHFSKINSLSSIYLNYIYLNYRVEYVTPKFYPKKTAKEIIIKILQPDWNWQSSWNTKDVNSLNETIYNEKRYELMPILADALIEAGCDNPEIINYCQTNQDWFRGDWVLDKTRRIR